MGGTEHEGAKKNSAEAGEAGGDEGIEELLALWMGCMGKSLADFCRCTPSEYEKIWKSWKEGEERAERAAWERTRMLCLCMLQPWTESRLEARDVLRFPWEEEPREKDKPSVDREEIMRRYKAAREAAGLK